MSQTKYPISWEELEESIKTCFRCPLHRYRRNPVPGEGSKTSKVMLIGEAPGATEDEMGRPFVGAAGKLLTLTLESIGIKREDVYITNVVKCRPPQNREPIEEEIENCSIYLESQISLLKPKVVVTLGNIAGKKIFSLASKPWNGVTRMRGKVYKLTILGFEVHVIPTIHPAAALYNPAMRTILLNDLKLVKDLLSSTSTLSTSATDKQTITKEDKENKKELRTLVDYIKKK
ncbi:MAG: type-4 uracil-DNA glycosylase [Ignisphaera sp.]